jgi:predicted transcriptional regulator
MGRLNRSRRKDLEVALRHPLRRRLLELVESADPPDVAELAELVGEPGGRVLYHLRVLAECGLAPSERTGENLGDRTT